MAETKRRGRPPGTKSPPGIKRKPGGGRKPKPPAEKLVKLTIAVSPDEAIRLAVVASTSGKTQRAILLAGVDTIERAPEHQAKLAEPYPPL